MLPSSSRDDDGAKRVKVDSVFSIHSAQPRAAESNSRCSSSEEEEEEVAAAPEEEEAAPPEEVEAGEAPVDPVREVPDLLPPIRRPSKAKDDRKARYMPDADERA